VRESIATTLYSPAFPHDKPWSFSYRYEDGSSDSAYPFEKTNNV